jgi:hypothetical protein
MRTSIEDITASLDPTRLADQALQVQHFMQRDRCVARLGLRPGEIEKMVSDFMASHGSATKCPTAYAMPSRQYRLRPHA